MPEDCFKFESFDHENDDFIVNDDMVRRDELKLAAELDDPFGDVFREMDTRKIDADAALAKDVFTAPDGLDANFTEGMQFDFC